jgi:hypothetical protein
MACFDIWQQHVLYKCCPTLSSLATCGVKRLKCDNKQLEYWISNGKFTTDIPQILTKEATDRIWMGTTVLYYQYTITSYKTGGLIAAWA